MRRRELILAAGATLGLPPAARAQPADKPIVAYLSSGGFAGRENLVEAFRKGLAEGGYVDGKNVTVELDWAGDDYGRLTQLVGEIVGRKVAVIVAETLAAALAAKRETSTVPIVFLVGDDPLRHGLVASLARPGGNATGISMLAVGLIAKRLELLREAVPGLPLIAVLENPDNANMSAERTEVQEAARAVNQPVQVFEARSPPEIETAFAALAGAACKALIVGSDPFFNSHRADIVALAARHRLPAIYQWREYAEAGGLLSYGTSLAAVNRQLGVYAGKVLAGAEPAALPVAQPITFELVVNLKTARALGLTVPPILLAQADEVIE